MISLFLDERFIDAQDESLICSLRNESTMKKTLILLSLFSFVSPLFSCRNAKTDDRVLETVNKAKEVMETKDMEDVVFPFVFQSLLEDSLCYSLSEGEYLISYKEDFYSYRSDRLLKEEASNYILVDNVEDAFSYPIGSRILTRGYYQAYDFGNACYLLKDKKEDKELCVSHEEEFKFLSFNSFDSSINLMQMGYRDGDYLDSYVNRFTKELDYHSFFLPEGNYVIKESFKLNASAKSYYSYDALITTDGEYGKTENSNGCAFYVSGDVSDIVIHGFSITPRFYDDMKADDPLLGILSARDVKHLRMDFCSFILPEEASIYSSSGLVDLFTGWEDVSVRNCHLENHASTKSGGGIGVRDIYKKGCWKALFENNYVYSNCKDEVIAIFSGADTSLYPDDKGGGSIEDVVFRNNKIVGAKLLDENQTRVVGITIGYQISPVKDVLFENNEIEMYSANYFLLYGKADQVTFRRNKVLVDASFMEDLYIPFSHNQKADPGKEILIEDNTFDFGTSSIYTLARGDEELHVRKNLFSGEAIVRVFDCHADFEENRIEFDQIKKCVYHDLKMTKDNVIECMMLTVLYEFYNLSLTQDVEIRDNVHAKRINAHLFMFNGSAIYFNGHSVTFSHFRFSADQIDSKYYYLAYSAEPLKDKAKIRFVNSDISSYQEEGHNSVSRDEKGMVEIFFE